MPENKPADVILLPRNVDAVAHPSLPDHGKIKPNRYDDGGDPPMKDDYVTHEELDHATDKINGRIDTLETKIDGQFNTLVATMNGKFDETSAKFDSITTKIDGLSKLIWWLMGLVGTGLIIPILIFVVHTVTK